MPPRSVKVVLETERSVYDDKPSSVTLEAKATRDNIFVVTTVNIPWFKKTGLKDNVWKRTSNRSSRRRPQIIVLGLPFLKNKSLIVDTDTKRLSIEEEV